MKNAKLIDTMVFFAGLGLLAMFVDQTVYKGNSLAGSYHFLMLGIALVFIFIYRRGVRILKDKDRKK